MHLLELEALPQGLGRAFSSKGPTCAPAPVCANLGTQGLVLLLCIHGLRKVSVVAGCSSAHLVLRGVESNLQAIALDTGRQNASMTGDTGGLEPKDTARESEH